MMDMNEAMMWAIFAAFWLVIVWLGVSVFRHLCDFLGLMGGQVRCPLCGAKCDIHEMSGEICRDCELGREMADADEVDVSDNL